MRHLLLKLLSFLLSLSFICTLDTLTLCLSIGLALNVLIPFVSTHLVYLFLGELAFLVLLLLVPFLLGLCHVDRSVLLKRARLHLIWQLRLAWIGNSSLRELLLRKSTAVLISLICSGKLLVHIRQEERLCTLCSFQFILLLLSLILRIRILVGCQLPFKQLLILL